jgi:hypothetical protein
MRLVNLSPARNNIHKYVAIVEDNNKKRHTIRFGAAGMTDFTKARINGKPDEARKERYLDRHRVNQNWNDPLTAGFWARWLLWNKPTISESLADLRKRFDL